MAEIKALPVAHACVDRLDSVVVISLKDVRNIASGQCSIAEFEDPEDVARTLACIAMDTLNDN